MGQRSADDRGTEQRWRVGQSSTRFDLFLNFFIYMHVLDVFLNFVEFTLILGLSARFILLSKQMDRSWIYGTQFTPAYVKGVEEFMKFVSERYPEDSHILCPCSKCLNQSLWPQDDVNDHIHIYGMSAAYTRWILMSTGPIFREVAGKFDLWRSRRWRSGFKSDAIRTLQPLHHCSVGYQPSTT